MGNAYSRGIVNSPESNGLQKVIQHHLDLGCSIDKFADKFLGTENDLGFRADIHVNYNTISILA